MSEAISAGDLRTRLTLEAPSRDGDGGGGAEVTWEAVAEVWAMVRTASGSEPFDLDRAAGRLSHEIIVRYRADVTLAMRMREGARVYDIRAAFDPDGRRHWLKCLVEERDL
jgi:SPP1 family predicted phage head-tail adaptor